LDADWNFARLPLSWSGKEVATKAKVKKIVIGIVGGTVLLIGIALIVLPGPAVIVIPMGLAILATEFEWGHRLKLRFHHKFELWRQQYREKKAARAEAKRAAAVRRAAQP
jgi:tellurite resistance protein TerC